MTLQERVRHIEIKTRRLSESVFAGEYRSSFKGRGMSFSEVREYQPGDDVRDIDWNVTARSGKPHMKVYEEERELTVMLLVDVSGSMDFGTSQASQRETAAEIAATLAFSAIKNNDKVGVIFFTDRIEKYIPPKKGRRHILFIIRELLSFRPKEYRTDMCECLEYFLRMTRRRCICFLISDFVGSGDFSRELSIAGRRHDFIALHVYDNRMKSLPDTGLLKIEDAESARVSYLDTSSPKVRKMHAERWRREEERLKEVFLRSKVDYEEISTSDDYVRKLIQLFQRR